MRNLLRLTGFLLVSVAILGFRFVTGNEEIEKLSLQQTISSIIAESTSPNSLWSVVLKDTSYNVLLEINGNSLVRPASNIKLLTSAAILDQLSPDYRLHTDLYIDGEIRDSVLYGDIHFRGGGNPAIDRHTYNEDPLIVMYEFVQALQMAGIERVEGDVFGNVSLFDDIPYPRGWEWDDLSYYYAPEISPLSFNGNTVYLTVDSNRPVGSAPGISWFPMNTDFVEFINEQLITARGSRFNEDYRRILGTNIILLRSTLPQGFAETEPLSITNPPLFFIDTFVKFAATQGLEITGGLITTRESKDWENYQKLHRHSSPELSYIIEMINKESDNFYTEMMVKYLAHHVYETTGSTELGLTYIREFAQRVGMDVRNLRMRDGSGMAPATLTTARDIAHLLAFMRNHEYADVYFQSLAVSGQDARMRNRFLASPLQGAINGKTGFVSGTRSLSGYLHTQQENQVVFSIITNNYTVPTRNIDAIHQQILEHIYEHF